MEKQTGKNTDDAQAWGQRYASATRMAPSNGSGGNRRPPDPPYELDTREGEPHAWQRHTYEGIWKAGRALTDHPDEVAVFKTEGDLDAAIRNMPTARSAWTYSRGRYDAEAGGVHYQGTVLGGTMSLFTCYPVSSAVGRFYDKGWLDDVLHTLRGAASATEFWEVALDLDDLWYDLRPFAKAPDEATGDEVAALDALRQRAKDALNACKLKASRDAIAALRTRFQEVQVASDERAAKEKAEKEARERLGNDLRRALSQAIKDRDLEAAQAHHAEMVRLGVFISPVQEGDLKALAESLAKQ
jgi:hypothetical protein